MNQVRLGVVGCGGMARSHMKYFAAIPNLKFTAAADAVADTVKLVCDTYPGVKGFDDGHKLIQSGEVDAVLIATPHYFHPEYAIAALKAGIHVLTEKPVAVTAKAAAEVNAEHARRPNLVYAAMFQMRGSPLWKRVKKIITSGQLGEIKRFTWIVTNWFRTQAYYDGGTWRATWKGEGGGVLLNQCPHNLDLLCWLVGSPDYVHAYTHIAKHHHIEVEDDVTAYLQWPNGATGVFITSTGEAPGTDRLEISGDNGKLVVENRQITFQNTYVPVSEFCATSDEAFGRPASDTISIEIKGDDPGHRTITSNFVQAILNPGTPLIGPGEEGLMELELSNAMLMSGVTKKPVQIPMDREAFDKLLKDLIANSKFEKNAVRKTKVDLAKSWH